MAEQQYLELRAGIEASSVVPPRAGPGVPPVPVPPPPPGRVDPPAVACTRRSFSAESLRTLWEGRVLDCFGPGFEWAETHTCSPRIGTGASLLLARVTDFDVAGGPWRRGYLRAILSADPLEAHPGASDGPASPEGVVLEAAAQAMAFYVTALGYTLKRDGWRFQPIQVEGVSEGVAEPALPLRGEVACELLLQEVREEPIPLIRATVVCTAAGQPVFRSDGCRLRLAPAWPLETMQHLVPQIRTDRPVARIGDLPIDERAVLAFALGRPSDALGELYRSLDGPRKAPRLPAPPYTCISRIVRVDGSPGEVVPGMVVEAELDIPPNAWYFGEGGNESMPFCLLLEAALQPTGWLVSYGGVAASATEDLHFRNLDGRCTVHREVRPRAETQHLRTVARLTRIARSGATTIVSFQIEGDIDGVPIISAETVSGMFTATALAGQRGLPHGATEEAAPSEAAGEAGLDGAASAAPARGRLRMLDRVTGYWPDGGRSGLGRLQAERRVRPDDWYFKAHFFQDPVQPGSLGLEAMLQLVQSLALRRGLHRGLEAPRFEAMALERELSWKYRGQVLPSSDLVRVEAEVKALTSNGAGRCITADGRLWVDGVCIYEAIGLAVRVVDDPAVGSGSSPQAPVPVRATAPRTEPLARYPGIVETVGERLRAGSDGAPWLDFEPVLPFWRRTLGTLPAPIQSLYTGLARQFVGRVVLDDPDGIDALRGRSIVFLANHQVQIESPLFSFIVSGLLDTLIVAISAAEHRTQWVGSLYEATVAWPGVRDPANLLYFDQRQQATLPPILDRLRLRMERERASLLVHVEGELQRSAGRPVERMSSVFIDLSIAAGVPIVPVRFARGLPTVPASQDLQLPLGYGRQDYHLGRPLLPDALAALPYAERRRVVLAALNGVGPPLSEEEPAVPDEEFARAADRWQREHGLTDVQAALLVTMAASGDLTLGSLVEHARAGSPAARTLAQAPDPAREWLERLSALVLGPD
jgi:3-hydroxymyristoyl/3-hydroxydecanoyl-(acyl carrier protein) dehydratase/1-acyl-sn-glycerol-3-phosphate acyltransferase